MGEHEAVSRFGSERAHLSFLKANLRHERDYLRLPRAYSKPERANWRFETVDLGPIEPVEGGKWDVRAEKEVEKLKVFLQGVSHQMINRKTMSFCFWK